MTILAIRKLSLLQRVQLSGLSVALVLSSACAAASGPTITDLKVVTGATQVSVGQEVAIAASISDPSGEPVTFNWSVQAGGQDKSRDIVSASPDVAAATYRPRVSGSHIITLQMLNKQKAVIASSNITIVAAEAQPTSLPSATVEVSSPTVAPTQGSPITATAQPLPSATVEATSTPALPTPALTSPPANPLPTDIPTQVPITPATDPTSQQAVNPFAAKLVSTETGTHYQVVDRKSGQLILTTHAEFPTNNDVKAGGFSDDWKKFAAAYHYGGSGSYTWIGVWSTETGKFLYSVTRDNWTTSLAGVFR